MNLGIFNRVNLKDSQSGMYSEWASLSTLFQPGSEESQSVLEKFAPGIGREVVLSVVRQLSANLGISQAVERSPFNADREVRWCMEVICYGLSLPLIEHDIIRDCVNVYCEWLSPLYTLPKVSVPKPIIDDSNFYARKIIGHFYNLFVPRKGEGLDTINRQALHCHRVLRTLQQIARSSRNLERETWETLLLFLVGVNDALLAPPATREDAGEQLCERVLGVLLEVWLIACERNFPSPPLWRTLRESCLRWRHRLVLVEQWNRVCLALTARVLIIMYGPIFPELKISDDDVTLVPFSMPSETVTQAWYRLLRTIGHPVDLCRPMVIAQAPAFLQYAITSSNEMDPCQHPCLQNLPHIFLKAIKGIAGHVDAFLGVSQACCWEECCVTSSGTMSNYERFTGKEQPQSSPTPPAQRRLAKSFSVNPTSVTKGMPKAPLIGLTTSRVTSAQFLTSNSGPSSTSSTASGTSLGQDIRPPLANSRPKCNSILHLFGEWLFEAAFIGTDGWSQTLPQPTGASKRPSSVLVDGPNSLQETVPEVPSSLGIERYESGRAEAMGGLCRIFCAKKTGEEILPTYLARFYQAMHHGLKIPETRECGEVLSSILTNSADLFRLDLDGVNVLALGILSALEFVLPDKDLRLKSSSVTRIELRRASIHLLISMLTLPLHFQNLVIRDLPSMNSANAEKTQTSFAQLKPRLMNLLINALQVETDPQNTHMLLGGLLLSVQDSASAEEVEQVTQPDVIPNENATNLLSSVTSDSASQISISSDLRSLGDNSDISYTLLGDTITFGKYIKVVRNNKIKGTVYLTDSAHALFVRATYLVCHRLMSSWKTDLNISLAALEMLSGLARTRIRETDALECKRAVKWLCDYITYQCWKPPPAHSKDLHSSIVAAFSCLTAWLTAHPQLLQDKDCLSTVFEVVELGVSGTKSVGKPGEPAKMKDEKELKPASMRVRDAAEALLTIILEQVGYFPSACGAQSLSSLVDEVSLLRHCNSWPGGEIARQNAVERFRYFVADNSTMLALLEEPLGNDQDPQPTITVLIRGPFGRHAWTMQLRHLPRHRSSTRSVNNNPGRPLPLNEPAPQMDYKPRFFPDDIDKIPHCKVDECIPSFDAIIPENEESRNSYEKLSILIERHIELEARANDNYERETEDNVEECAPPKICHEFQTARLFLSHFGFLNLDFREDDENGSGGLKALDPTLPGFCADLESLDQLSPRTCDTVHIFYVKSGQKSVEAILSNVMHESNVSPNFLEFLNSLGWAVSVNSHAGWTGHVSTSWRASNHVVVPQLTQSDHGGSLYNGTTHLLYWADVSSEIAFIVPTQSTNMNSDVNEENIYDSSGNQSPWYERSASESSGSRSFTAVLTPRAMSFDLDLESGPPSVGAEPVKPRRTIKHMLPPQNDVKIIIVWLESFEDHAQFPVGDVLRYTHTGLENPRTTHNSDIQVIFLQTLASGLLRVKLQGPTSRINIATPLVDGMVVSRRALGSMVRQTALNMGRRRRLDNDSYHPPHVRRRLKIEEMVQKFRQNLQQPELLTLLFNDPQII